MKKKISPIYKKVAVGALALGGTFGGLFMAEEGLKQQEIDEKMRKGDAQITAIIEAEGRKDDFIGQIVTNERPTGPGGM